MDRELSEVEEVDWDAFHASTDVEFRSAILEAANRQREGVR
jgi:hypothetical protein